MSRPYYFTRYEKLKLCTTIAAAMLIIGGFMVGRARADDPAYNPNDQATSPHSHGVDVPDWYDPDCCNTQDCRPVPDEEIAFGVNEFGEAVVIHLPTKLAFPKFNANKTLLWRTSKDERYHVCFRGTTVFTGFCVYLRAGA